MDDAKRELVRAWLVKAGNDLDTAYQIKGLPQGHLDVAIYHCQQAAEKAVKGFLALHDHRLERTHDVERLVTLASDYEKDFGQWVDAAITLTPYATAYRYPGQSALMEPSSDEFDEALKCARDIVAYVLSVVPAEVQSD